MAGVVTASLTVDFSDDAYSRDGLVVLQRSNRQAEKDYEVYFRAHGIDGHAISSTSGSISRVISNLSRYTVEFLTFTGQSEVQLQYPNPKNLTWAIQGSVYDKSGQRLGKPVIKHDTARNVIRFPEHSAVHGVLLVKYEAPYQLWLAKFGGACPTEEPNEPPLDLTKGTPDDDVFVPGREPMMIMAWKAGKLDASLNLEAPECVYDSGGAIIIAQKTQGAEQPRLQIEPDEDDPPRLISSESANWLSAGGHLRIYPGDGGASTILSASAGSITRYNSTVITRVMRETITFSGSSTASLKYPVKLNSGVAVTRTGAYSSSLGIRLIDSWGRETLCEFRTPGERFTVVSWISRNTYTNPITRTVNRNELVVVDMHGRAIEVYGAVNVEYTTTYFRIKYKYANTSDGDLVPAVIVGRYEDMSGSYTLEVPNTRVNRGRTLELE